jgi:hypothetical protein
VYKTKLLFQKHLLTCLVGFFLFAFNISVLAQQYNVILSAVEEQTQPWLPSLPACPAGEADNRLPSAVLERSRKGAEPQFKFWLAFEDSTGQTDTLWVVIDSTAKSNQTLPYDSILGELPLLKQDSGKFLVYYKIHDYDSFKVVANTPSFKEVSISILAQNYHLPITIRWDTSLLSNNNLPWDIRWESLYNGYIFFNYPTHYVELLKKDSLTLPKFSAGGGNGNHFPLEFYLTEEDFDPNTVSKYNKEKQTIIYPNPGNGRFKIESTLELRIEKVDVFNLLGEIIYTTTKNEIDLSNHGFTNQMLIIKIKYYENIETSFIKYIFKF